ncbi:Major heat shock 70 kDa protein Bb [Tulasnella sp. 408]|nr:Major heat shock 70 kDa protein Bb [Tulasnella sp. 408]
MVLGKMKETTAAYLGEKVTPAAVTVPVVSPTPTSDYQGCQYLLSVEDGDFEILATAGDTHLGGEDFSLGSPTSRTTVTATLAADAGPQGLHHLRQSLELNQINSPDFANDQHAPLSPFVHLPHRPQRYQDLPTRPPDLQQPTPSRTSVLPEIQARRLLLSSAIDFGPCRRHRPRHLQQHSASATKDPVPSPVSPYSVCQPNPPSPPPSPTVSTKTSRGTDESHIIVYDLGGGAIGQYKLTDPDNGHPRPFTFKANAAEASHSRHSRHSHSLTLNANELSARVTCTLASGLGPTAYFENGNDCSETFTRAKFEELNLSRKTLKPVEQVLKHSPTRGEPRCIAALCNAKYNAR